MKEEQPKSFFKHDVLHTLQWRHIEPDGASNHQPHDCLLHHLFRRRSKKTWKLSVTGLCAGNSLVTGEFRAQMASHATNVSIWWRHHGDTGTLYGLQSGILGVSLVTTGTWHQDAWAPVKYITPCRENDPNIGKLPPRRPEDLLLVLMQSVSMTQPAEYSSVLKVSSASMTVEWIIPLVDDGWRGAQTLP